MDLQKCEYTKVNTGTQDDDGKEDQTANQKHQKQESENVSVSYFQLYKFATPLDKCLIAIGLITSFVAAVTSAIFYYITGTVTNAIIQFEYSTKSDPNEILKAEEELMATLHRFLINMGLLLGLVIACTYVTTYLFNFTALNQVFKIRKLYFASILNQDIAWHDQNQTGDFASRNTDDLKKIQDSIGEKASMFVSTVTHILACILLALYLGWELTLISSTLIPIIFTLTWYISWVTTKLSTNETELFGEASVVAEETLTGIKTVVAFDGQKSEKERYSSSLKSVLVNNVKRYKFLAFNAAAAKMFSFLCSAVTLWYGIKLTVRNRESLLNNYNAEVVVAILLSLTFAYYYITTLLPLLEVMNTGKATATKIFEVISSTPVINQSHRSGTNLSDLQGSVKFVDVAFNYPSRRDTKVLQGLSFSINSGETVALVGSSGCGKSTCIQLLQRFYDPDSGNILIDDNDLSQLDLAWWRSKVGVVNQEPVLFEATIAQNIKLGFLDATQTDIEEAAAKANAHEFITSFPKGYDTVIGESGAQLSGGQKQRIAIARALIRKPTILLLDEATSALDSNSEEVVQAALDAASKDCTTIIVAHRLSTVKNADKIIFISEGRAVEEGSHEQLLAQKGPYEQLVNTYFKHSETKVMLPNSDSQREVVNHETKLQLPREEVEVSEKNEELNITESYSTFRELIKVSVSEQQLFLVGCLPAILVGLTIPAYGYIYGGTLSMLSDADNEKVFHVNNINFIKFIIVSLIMGLLTFFQVYLVGIAGEKLVFKLRTLMFSSILNQEISWFDRSENGVGALGARLSGEVANVQGALGQKISTVLNCIPAILMTLIVCFIMEYRLLFISLCLSPILVLSTYLEYKLLQKENHIHSDMLEKSTKLGVEVINNIRTVASLSIENRALKMYMATLTLYGKVAKQNAHVRGIVFGISSSSFHICHCLSLYFGALLIKRGYTDSISVLSVSEIVVSTVWYTANALAFSPNFNSGLSSFRRILKVINRQQLIKNSNKQIEAKEDGDINYNQIEFAYPTRPDAKILNNFNLSVLKGHTVALVGSSGCGKSTIIQLLERFYDATSGQIIYGNQDISEINLTEHRMRLAVVSQEPSLFSRTILENIAYGDNRRTVSRAEIIKAAQKASIHNFVSALPLGYDTKLGEKGTQLSGGQKQRIAIARALVRNPEVLLLDEATSSLDAENERIVQEALDNAKEGRTCIVIAHNLKTIQNANVIVVMNDGKICESGTHTDLINNENVYEKLYNAQN